LYGRVVPLLKSTNAPRSQSQQEKQTGSNDNQSSSSWCQDSDNGSFLEVEKGREGHAKCHFSRVELSGEVSGCRKWLGR